MMKVWHNLLQKKYFFGVGVLVQYIIQTMEYSAFSCLHQFRGSSKSHSATPNHRSFRCSFVLRGLVEEEGKARLSPPINIIGVEVTYLQRWSLSIVHQPVNQHTSLPRHRWKGRSPPRGASSRSVCPERVSGESPGSATRCPRPCRGSAFRWSWPAWT